MKEIWRDVEGFVGKYLISNLGRVKSICAHRGKCGNSFILKPFIQKQGYVQIKLQLNGKSHHRRVSRLVAIAFHPNPLNKPQVNHKNGNKLDNTSNNLEWTTSSENLKHAFKTGLKTSDHIKKANRKATWEDVCKIRMLRGMGHKIPEIHKELKLPLSVFTVYAIARGDTWKSE